MKLTPKTLFLSASLAVAAIFVGCTSHIQTVAYKGSTATDGGVRLAMTGWGLYVGQKHPGTNAEQQVLLVFNTVKNAELGVIDASAQLLSNSQATNQAIAADIILSNAQKTLLSTIATYTNIVK